MFAWIKKINLFTILLVVVMLSFSYRLNHFVNGGPGGIPSAQALEESNETPPPLPLGSDASKSAESDKMPAMHADQKTKEINRIQKERGLPEIPMLSFTPADVEVLQNLSKRRKALDARDKSLKQREALLLAAEKQLDQKLVELTKIRGELQTLLEQQSEQQEQRMRKLVKIYEGMKPKEAARIFDTMDMDVLLAVISQMSDRKTAPIMAAMQGDRAREITRKLMEQPRLPELP